MLIRGTSGHGARIAWGAVVLSATLASGLLVAGATQSATAVAESVVAIERTTVTSTSRTAPTPPTPADDDTVTLRNPQPVAPSTVAQASTVETTSPAVTTTQPAASTTTVQLEVPVTAAAETSVAPAATEQATEAAVEVTVPAPTNQSSCRNDLPGAVMTIAMPDISYTCSVFAGGQSVIDAGAATMITAQYSGLSLAVHPGEAGTLWITGHRVSHGGPFAAVPDLPDGAIITVSDGTVTASYVIVGRSYVEIRDGLAVDATGQATGAATLDAVLRPDRNGENAARLLLQTCDGEHFRWMIYADLVEA